MSESGFPPPKPAARDLNLESAASQEYYRLQEAGTLPKGADGEPMGFTEFMDRVYEDAGTSGGAAMERSEFDDGTSVSVDPNYKGKSSRDQGRKRRGQGKHKDSGEGDTANESEVQAESTALDYEKLGQDLERYRSALDSAHSAILSAKQKINLPSTELLKANENYRQASNDLIAHEDEYSAGYPKSESGFQAAEKEIGLLKKALVASERLLSIATEETTKQERESSPAPKENERPTQAEGREALRRSVAEVEAALQKKTEGNNRFSQGEAVYQLTTDRAKQAYFDALAKYQKDRGTVDAVKERLGLTSKRSAKEVNALKDLKKEWIEARANQARYRLENVEERRSGRGGSARAERDSQKVKERYERMVVARDILRNAVLEEQKVRINALRTRDKSFIEKAWNAYRNLPPNVRNIVSGAAIGVTASGAIMTGGVLAALPILALGGANLGARILAEGKRKELLINEKRIAAGKGELEEIRKQAYELEVAGDKEGADAKQAEFLKRKARDEKKLADLKKEIQRRDTAGSFNLFGLGSFLAGKLVRKDKAQEIRATGLTKEGNNEGKDLSSSEVLERYGEAMASAGVAHQSRESLRSSVKTAGGFAGGFVGGAAVGEAIDILTPDSGSGDAGTPNEGNQVERTDGAAQPEAPQTTETPADSAEGSAAETQASGAEAPAAASTPEAPNGSLVTSAAEANSGDGFSHLIARIDTSNIENPSAVVEKLRALSPAELSRMTDALREIEGGTESVRIHGGDQLVLDQDQNLWFVRTGEEPQLLMENSASAEGGVVFHKLEDVHYSPDQSPAPVQPTRVEQEVTQTPAAEVVTETVPAEDAVSATAAAESTPEAAEESDSAAPAAPESQDEESVRTLGTEDAVRALRGEAVETTPTPVAEQGVDTEGVRTLSTEEAVRGFTDASASGAETFTNPNGVEVNPSEPATYTWRVPGTNLTYPVAYGGSYEEYSAFARAQVAADPTKIFLFATPLRDSLGAVTGMRIDAWDAGLDGVPRMNEGMVNPDTGRPLPPVNANDFIR